MWWITKKWLLFLSLVCTSHAYIINIDANEHQCFFERVVAGTKMALLFEVAEGGFLDIDVGIVGPDGREIYKGERESSSKYMFAAHMDGVYTYCFDNKMSTMTPKTVAFSMQLTSNDQPPAAEADATRDSTKLGEMVSELFAALLSVKHEQEYMDIRERVHRAINDNTNSRVMIWAFFEALILVSMTAGQIYYLKRFFEVRRVI